MGTRLGSLDVGGALADTHKLLVQQGGVDKQVLVSAASASEAAKGFAELATTAEAQAGTDDERIITPAKLQDVTALATRAGVIELGTQAEVDAGTDGVRAVTPATLLGSPAAAFLRLFYVEEQKATGVDSATILSAVGPAAVARRDLVEVVDTLGVDGSGDGSVGGTNNTQVTLPAGTYWLEADAMVHILNGDVYAYSHRLEWYNTSDAASALHGPTARAESDIAAGNITNWLAELSGKFTIAASKTFELRHWGVDEGGTVGGSEAFGGSHSGAGIGSFGEIYSRIRIWQLAVG